MKKKLNPLAIGVILLLSVLQPRLGVSQVYQNLYDFDGINGSGSFSKLVSNGIYLYGMTLAGGLNDKGVIYKLKPDGTDFEKLHDFDGPNGEVPYNSLTLIGSELFGVTFMGGAANSGVIFKINTDGTNFTKILDLLDYNGQLPQSSLYYDGTYLYGTTYAGGNTGGGLMYKVKPDGTDFSVIYHFSNTSLSPSCDLVFDGTYFYGVTYNGNQTNNSTIYKIKPDGSDFQKIHDFPDTFQILNVNPSELILYNGYLYGVTLYSETTLDGYLYKIMTDGTNFSILHHFDLTTGNNPWGGLIIAGDYLYGTTSMGGNGSVGAIYRIKPDGTDFSKIFDFAGNTGYTPRCGLYYDNYSLYGVTSHGGSFGDFGTIFKFNDEILTSSVDFSGNDLNFKLRPNPAIEDLSIELSEVTFLKITDIFGKEMFNQKLNAGSNTLDISTLNSGVYFLQTENGEVVKFIKK